MTSAGTPYWADFLQRSVCVNWMEYTYVETSYALMATPTCVQKINQVLFSLYIFLVYFNYSEHNYSALWYFLYAGELFITKWYYTMEMEARRHHSAQVVVVIQQTPTPAYNVVAVSRDRTGL